MTYPRTTWRLVRTPPAKGAWNMAVDEALLESVGRGKSPPTLRLYAWDPPCLSLGFAQSVRDVDLEKLIERGWDLVRRPTGGRAILHTDELTYAVIGTQDDPRLSGGVLDSYRRLSHALLAALHIMGVSARADEIPSLRKSSQIDNPICFEVPSNFEITVEGKKIIGSAQARRQNSILQHGSVPLQGDLTRITQVLRFRDELERKSIADRIINRAMTLESALGYPVGWETASRAIVRGFEKALDIEFQQVGLSPEEGIRAFDLYRSKYNHPDWINEK